MTSRALSLWNSTRSDRLDELEDAHTTVAGPGPGRKWRTEQLDRAYVLAIVSEFQGFCRDLHTQSAAAIAAPVPVRTRAVVDSNLTFGRKLDRGNPNGGNLGSDFGRFGFDFWDEVEDVDARNKRRRERLEQALIWRNSIVHADRIPQPQRQLLENTKPTLYWGRRWRRALGSLAPCMDRVVVAHLQTLLGQSPW